MWEAVCRLPRQGTGTPLGALGSLPACRIREVGRCSWEIHLGNRIPRTPTSKGADREQKGTSAKVVMLRKVGKVQSCPVTGFYACKRASLLAVGRTS